MSSGFPSAGGRRGGNGGFGSGGGERGDRGGRDGGGTFRGFADFFGRGDRVDRGGDDRPGYDDYRDRRGEGRHDFESRDQRHLRSRSPAHRHREERQITRGSGFDYIFATLDRDEERREERRQERLEERREERYLERLREEQHLERLREERLREERLRSPPRGPRQHYNYPNQSHPYYPPMLPQAPPRLSRGSNQWINPDRINPSSNTTAPSPSSQVIEPVVEQKKKPQYYVYGIREPLPKWPFPRERKETDELKGQDQSMQAKDLEIQQPRQEMQTSQQQQQQRMQAKELQIQQLRQENQELKTRNLGQEVEQLRQENQKLKAQILEHEMQRRRQQFQPYVEDHPDEGDDVPEDSNPDRGIGKS